MESEDAVDVDVELADAESEGDGPKRIPKHSKENAQSQQVH